MWDERMDRLHSSGGEKPVSKTGTCSRCKLPLKLGATVWTNLENAGDKVCDDCHQKAYEESRLRGLKEAGSQLKASCKKMEAHVTESAVVITMMGVRKPVATMDALNDSPTPGGERR